LRLNLFAHIFKHLLILPDLLEYGIKVYLGILDVHCSCLFDLDHSPLSHNRLLLDALAILLHCVSIESLDSLVSDLLKLGLHCESTILFDDQT